MLICNSSFGWFVVLGAVPDLTYLDVKNLEAPQVPEASGRGGLKGVGGVKVEIKRCRRNKGGEGPH